MRQTDCLAFVRTYYEYGMNFFEPRVFNLNSTEGKAIGEFPILYYLTALMYKIVGEHEFILRLINLILVTTGFFYVYRLLLILLSDIIYSLGFTLLFFSSTILIYYTNNFLPDAGALGITLIGWYYFYQYLTSTKSKKFYIVAIILFTLSALIKVTYGINLAAATLTMATLILLDKEKINFRKLAGPTLLFTFAYLTIIVWYIFVIQYNKANMVDSFLTHSTPIWKLSNVRIASVWDYISNYWYTKYYYETTIHSFVIIIIVGAIFISKSNIKILIIAISTTIGSIIYILLFYGQFGDHDYYFIAIIPMIIFLVINSFIAIRNRFPKLINNIFVKIAVIILVILSINYAKEKLTVRYDGRADYYADIGKRLNNADKYLDSLGVKKSAKFIVIKDFTPNGSLYFINRTGWTFKVIDKSSIDDFQSNLIEANYILLTNDSIKRNSIIANIDMDKIGTYNNVTIYKLEK